MLEFVQRHTDNSTGHHLAGSSVHVDLAFMRRGMPRLAAHMPYRVVVRFVQLSALCQTDVRELAAVAHTQSREIVDRDRVHLRLGAAVEVRPVQ